MQLIAYGAQDIYLTGNPQITFFKVVYRRHTNFSMEPIEQILNGTQGYGQTVTATISRNGDLIHKMYLEHETTLTTDHVNGHNALVIASNYGNRLMKEVELEIGGQRINKHTGHWMNTWSQLTEFNPEGSNDTLYNKMSGNGPPIIMGKKKSTTNDNYIILDILKKYHENKGEISFLKNLENEWVENGDTILDAITKYKDLCILFDINSLADPDMGALLTDEINKIIKQQQNAWNIEIYDTGDSSFVDHIVQAINPGTDNLVEGQSYTHKANGKMFIPLQFWFCKTPGLSLPLIALQYHEVKVKINFEDLINLAVIGESLYEATYPAKVEGKTSFKLYADYIYLDTDERRRFAQVSHEYLIEQVQHSLYNGGESMVLHFNHPVKELIWTKSLMPPKDIQHENNIDPIIIEVDKQDKEYSRINSNNWTLKLNGHDRFSERKTEYFTRVQLWQHHTGYPRAADSIGVYSFSLNPEEHQPSGTCNFSRIDNAQLVTDDISDFHIYSVNYNILRIMSGMGGLAYSN